MKRNDLNHKEKKENIKFTRIKKICWEQTEKSTEFWSRYKN